MSAARAECKSDAAERGPAICPSAQADEDAVVLGIVGKRNGRVQSTVFPRQLPLAAVAHLLPESIPATDMLRLGAPCAGRGCGHFSDGRCRLAARIVARLAETADDASPCALRETCLWRRQEGPAVCRRCPQITDEPSRASDVLSRVAKPVLAWSKVA